MREEKIYQRINQIDEKHMRKADELRAEMNLMIQSFHGHISDMTTSTAVLSERFKQMRDQVVNMPKPEARPCPFFNKHIEDHEKIRFVLVKSVIGAIVTAVVTALGTLFVWRHTP